MTLAVLASGPGQQRPELAESVYVDAVVVAPIRIGGGMRMKVLHAMSLGKAVVTTSCGIEGLQVAGETCPVLVVDSAREISDAIVALLRAPERRASLGAAARELVERRFGPEAYARRLEQTYEAIRPLSARPSPTRCARACTEPNPEWERYRSREPRSARHR